MKNESAERKFRLSKRGGLALVFVLGVFTFLATLQLQLFSRGMWQARTSERVYDRSNALYLADAAVKQAAVNLRTTDTSDDVNDGSLSTGSFEVDAPTHISGNLYSVVGRGTSENEQREIEAIILLSPRSIFQFALFGDQGIEVDGSAETDGYDSSLGPYDEDTNSTPNGDVGTNGSTFGDVDLGGSAYIDGQVAVGYDVGDPYAVVNNYDPDYITGGTDPPSDYQDVVAQTESFPMPAVTIPVGLTCSDETVGSSSTVTLSPTGGPLGNGTYCYNDLTLQGGGTLTSSGKVTVYITGALTAKGNSTIGYPTDPKSFLVEMTWTSDATLEPGTLTGTTGFYGALYAPDSTINITGNAEIYGSIVAGQVNVTGSAAVHYDEALMEQQDITNGFDTEQVSWREL